MEEEEKVKARYFASQSKIKSAVSKELQSRSDEIFKSVAEQLLPQIAGVECYVLRTAFGFGKKRLMKFLEEKNSLYGFISANEEIAGRKLSTKDVQDEMEKYLGIRFQVTEFSIQDTPKSRKRRLK